MIVRVPVHTHRGARSKRLVLVAVFALMLVGTIVSVGWSYAGAWATEQISAMGGTPSGSLADDFKTLRELAWPRKQAATANSRSIPTLTFDVKFKNIKKLARKRQEALERNYLIQEEGDYVNATVRVENGDERSVARTRIRLKGDFTDHLKGDKWSFRVKTKGDDHILGMRVFSLQHPRVRGYSLEPIFLDHMRSEGVLAPRYFFVRLVVNGNDKGIMALEEHFSKELLESQKRRDSVIVRFDETLKWRSVHLMGQEVNFTAPYPFVRPFQVSKLTNNPERKAQLDAAVALLRSFLSKKLNPSQVFDPDITARFLAVCEIWGARHAQAWNNLRFYYNPLTGFLEPIAFDANLQDYAFRYIPTCLVSVYRLGDDMTSRWLDDARIRQPFLRDLKRLSNSFVQESTVKTHKATELANNQVLHQEFPLISEIPWDFYRQRSMRLGNITAENYGFLPLMPPNYPALMHAFLTPSPAGYRLELYNLVPYPLEIRKVQLDPKSLRLSRELPITLAPTTGLAAPEPLALELTSPDDNPAGKGLGNNVIVTARIQGYPHTQTNLRASAYPEPATAPILPTSDWNAISQAHPYIKHKAGEASLGPGEIEIKSPLILPHDTSLTIAPGTTLRFAPAALLVVRGSLHMRGTRQAPIRLAPQRETWGGVAVFGSGKPSEWSHVEVRNTTGLEYGAWQPTGSVMFYESKVKLTSCSIRDNQSEDTINLVRSEFTMSDVTIERTSSDAIDIDFCKGVIQGGAIRHTTGDGIDVSESDIRIDGTQFDGIKDKALSIGERSQMQAREVSIKDCGTGLASKDGSTARIENSSMTTVKYAAIMAYTKKPEFGGAHVHVKDVKIQNTRYRHIAQRGSTMVVDGKEIETVLLDVEALYTTGHMKK